MFLCLISLSNSSFVLILHVPSLSFAGPKIFLSTFLSNIWYAPIVHIGVKLLRRMTIP